MRTFSIALSFFAILLISCSHNPGIYVESNNDNTVVGKVGNQNITYGDLKNQFNKGAKENPTLEELEEFLPVYLNYVAKIQSARAHGYFEDPEIEKEYQKYGKQAAYSYWLEYKIKPTEFENYYRKVDKEVKSEHVLVVLPEDAEPADTLEAYERVMNARNEYLKGGITMQELDEKHSSHAMGRRMGGELPWFGVGTTVLPFEDAVYSLEVGEISMPVRTNFGYHIIHLSDIREAAAARRVSHIFITDQSETGEEKINEAFDALEDGNDWNEVTKKYSNDELSAKNGGNIGWIKYGQSFAPDFVDVIMEVDPTLSYTEPIKTQYGYHIFKIDSVRTFANEEEKREAYMQEFLDSPNFRKSNTFVVDWIRRNTDFVENHDLLNQYFEYLHENPTTRMEDIELPDFADEIVFAFKGDERTIQELHEYILKYQSSARARESRKEWAISFMDKLVDDHIVDLAVKEFSDFDEQLDNYKAGLVVYQINEDNMWSAETVDSTALYNIYENNINRYSYGDREFYYLMSSTDSTLYDAVNFIKEGNEPDSIRVHYPKVAVVRDSSGIKIDEYSSFMENLEPGEFSEEFEYKRKNTFIYLRDILPARHMSFEESFNRLLAEYQPVREKEWLDSLEKNYPMKTDVNNLRKAYNADPDI